MVLTKNHFVVCFCSKEMESEDIEDGEILEDESNQGEEACPPAPEAGEHYEPRNNLERFFGQEKKVPHHRPHDYTESHKTFRRDRSGIFPPGLKKRKRSDEEAYGSEKYHAKVIRRRVLKNCFPFRKIYARFVYIRVEEPKK